MVSFIQSPIGIRLVMLVVVWEQMIRPNKSLTVMVQGTPCFNTMLAFVFEGFGYR
jgi:hypothetical protein